MRHHALEHDTDSPQWLALARRSGLTAAHCQALSNLLPTAIGSLWRRRAAEVPEGHLDDYVKLGWLAWSRGTLVITPAGQLVHDTVAVGGAG